MENKPQKKYLSKSEALGKLQRYCAYQDRCHKEVRSKLLGLNIYGDDLEEIIVELIQEKFLDEERFSRSYARGKFRMKKWGRMRIKRELKMRDISAYCIKKAMTEINEKEYINTLADILKKKNKLLKEPTEFIRKNKLVKYAVGRGFEYELAWEAVNGMFE